MESVAATLESAAHSLEVLPRHPRAAFKGAAAAALSAQRLRRRARAPVPPQTIIEHLPTVAAPALPPALAPALAPAPWDGGTDLARLREEVALLRQRIDDAAAAAAAAAARAQAAEALAPGPAQLGDDHAAAELSLLREEMALLRRKIDDALAASAAAAARAVEPPPAAPAPATVVVREVVREARERTVVVVEGGGGGGGGGAGPALAALEATVVALAAEANQTGALAREARSAADDLEVGRGSWG